MTSSSWQCAACLTFNGDGGKPCVACGGTTRREEPVVIPHSSVPVPPRFPPRSAPVPPRSAPVLPRSYRIPATPPRRGLQRGLTVAVVVAGLLLGIVLVFTNHRGDGSNGAGGTPGQGGTGTSTGTVAQNSGDDPAGTAAKRLDALLAESVDGRKHLLTAIDSALACDKSSAVSEMKAASSARKALIGKVGGTDLSGLSGGDSLKSLLSAFLKASYSSDQAYLHWVQAASGCPSTGASAFHAVDTANSHARAGKTAFLDRWNPIAERYHLPVRAVTSI